MVSYKIIVEDMMCNNCARTIRQALEAKGKDVIVSCNVGKKEVTIDSNLSVEEIYATIEEAGFTPTDLELA